jgi:hypothetical protein
MVTATATSVTIVRRTAPVPDSRALPRNRPYNTGGCRRRRARRRTPRDGSLNVLLLHGNGWDELLLIGGAILLAVVVVRLTSRSGGDEPADTPES